MTFSNNGSNATAFSATTGAGADTLSLRGGNLTSASTGGGADSVSLTGDAAAASTKVDLGDGDDTLRLDWQPTTGASLDGGAGTDTVRMASALAEAASAGTAFQATISNFEKLRLDAVAGGKKDTVNLKNVDGISYVRSAGTAAATGTAEVQTYGFGSADPTGGQITFGGVNIDIGYSEYGGDIAMAVAAQQAAIILANPDVTSVTADYWNATVTVTYNVLAVGGDVPFLPVTDNVPDATFGAPVEVTPGVAPVGEVQAIIVNSAPIATGYFLVQGVRVDVELGDSIAVVASKMSVALTVTRVTTPLPIQTGSRCSLLGSWAMSPQ